jgi:hypothetical protein
VEKEFEFIAELAGCHALNVALLKAGFYQLDTVLDFRSQGFSDGDAAARYGKLHPKLLISFRV